MAEVDRDVGVIVARMVGDSAALDDVAEAFRDEVKRLAPVRTGAFRDSIKVKKVPGRSGVTDRLIYSDDPAAVIIEHGYESDDGTFVAGNFPFHKAHGG
ncbi:HK97 gp10 family phage protein [Kocuria salina]|uniref:HK97 gp10 family phage protein n=1 Tax=Kocuria salina TaxID=1929416 RepID=UPI001594BCF4|nr:HK97 gp10 family phage protein [Kocuria salina]NVC23403.1 HK97 gp10 family phage protein [Kocuria salina]